MQIPLSNFVFTVKSKWPNITLLKDLCIKEMLFERAKTCCLFCKTNLGLNFALFESNIRFLRYRSLSTLLAMGKHSVRGVASLTVRGGQEFYFPHYSSNFYQFLFFPKIFLIFVLNMALRVGKSPTREGPGYATALSCDPF